MEYRQVKVKNVTEIREIAKEHLIQATRMVKGKILAIVVP